MKRSEIAQAVDDASWQMFRCTLKGDTTVRKLKRLQEYLDVDPQDRARQIRVENYLNALKRGGQLDVKGDVQR